MIGFSTLLVFAPSGCDGEPQGDGRPTEGVSERASPPRPSASAARASSAPAASAAPAPPKVRVRDPDDSIRKAPLEAQRRYVLDLLRSDLDVSAPALERVEKIFARSDWLGLGNPRISEPALARADCRARRAAVTTVPGDPECGAPNMVHVPAAAGAGVCIDQFEFPNVPCEYPVVWVRASEAAALCDALGKRLCDAHEWEGGCAGRVLEPDEDYAWDRLPKLYDRTPKRDRRLMMEHLHNESREITWAYGKQMRSGVCGTSVRKDARCTTVDWGICPTRSYPTGAFPECVSSVGVYDQHGNVAEHMSLPLHPEELGGRGDTEMKGSWFAFDYEAPHPDDCRWRAKNWHTTPVDHFNSHRSYHLGFRCCKDIE